MDRMPLIVATAIPKKAALAQGGFFVFSATLLSKPFSRATLHAIASRSDKTCRPPLRQFI
jgi:hypothetical protein